MIKAFNPFGEYIPLRNVININKLTYGSIDYQAGTSLKVLDPKSAASFSAYYLL